ncbi:MAG: glycosyltransferase [bacterium]
MTPIAAKHSVIITVYNSESTIGLVLEQLKAITGAETEVIIVDDGSTDNTVKEIENFKLDSVNLISPGKIGRAKALNLALHHSTGETIFINDADDVSTPARFQASVEMLKECEVVFGHANLVTDVSQYSVQQLNDQTEDSTDSSTETVTAALLYKTNPLTHSTMAIKRDLLLRLGGYDESLDVCVDLDLYFRALVAGSVMRCSGTTFISRTSGSTRKFASFPSERYFDTLLSVRSKYRNKLKPPLRRYAYDLRLVFQKFLAKR